MEPKVCKPCRDARKIQIASRTSANSIASVGGIGNSVYGAGVGTGASSKLASSNSENVEGGSSKGQKRRNDGNGIENAAVDSCESQDVKRVRRVDRPGEMIAPGRETDPTRIEQRLKQIQYGYNTAAYDHYIATVPKEKRIYGKDEHPRTPDVYEIQSKRAFEGRLKKWRRGLHIYDLNGADGELVEPDLSVGKLASKSSSESDISPLMNSRSSGDANVSKFATNLNDIAEGELSLAAAVATEMGNQSDSDDDVL